MNTSDLSSNINFGSSLDVFDTAIKHFFDRFTPGELSVEIKWGFISKSIYEVFFHVLKHFGNHVEISRYSHFDSLFMDTKSDLGQFDNLFT